MGLKGEYKGYEVRYDDYSEFFAIVGNSRIYAKTLDQLTRKIDGIERKNFKRTNVLKEEFSFGKKGIIQCEVTSHTDDGKVWTNSKVGRSKDSPISLYLDTEDNRKKLARIAEIKNEMAEANRIIGTVMDSIERYEIKEVKC